MSEPSRPLTERLEAMAGAIGSAGYSDNTGVHSAAALLRDAASEIARLEGERREIALARTILRGGGGDRSDRDTLRELWRLLLPDECGQDGTEESEGNARASRHPGAPSGGPPSPSSPEAFGRDWRTPQGYDYPDPDPRPLCGRCESVRVDEKTRYCRDCIAALAAGVVPGEEESA